MKVRVSQGVAEGHLIHRVEPDYPLVAKAHFISGVVLLGLTISTTGNVESIHALQGDPVLVRASIDAVKQWKYKPYTIKGVPVEVESTVKITFHLR